MNLETKRLFYERITAEHAEKLSAELCDARVYQYIDDGLAPTPPELRESFVQREFGSPPHRSSEIWLDYAVFLKGTGIAIGRVEATALATQAEVAFLFGRPYWGLGYGTEAVLWLQQRLVDLHATQEFWATVKPGNRRSTALLQRLGYLEAPSPRWPAKLTSYDQGDQVFSLAATQLRREA